MSGPFYVQGGYKREKFDAHFGTGIFTDGDRRLGQP
jgi:hypothetical protein